MVADEVSRSNGLQVERASAARVAQSKQHGRAGSSAPYRAACATSPFAAVAGGMEYAYKLCQHMQGIAERVAVSQQLKAVTVTARASHS